MTYRRASGVSASRASSSMWSPPPEHRGPVPTAPPARDSLTSRQSANPSLPQIANPLRRSSAKPRASFLPPAKASSNRQDGTWRNMVSTSQPRGNRGSLSSGSSSSSSTTATTTTVASLRRDRLPSGSSRDRSTFDTQRNLPRVSPNSRAGSTSPQYASSSYRASREEATRGGRGDGHGADVPTRHRASGGRSIHRESGEGPAVVGAAAGLSNLGNTCFMNSVLQCLAHTPALLQVFADNQVESDSQDRLVIAFASLIRSLWRQRDRAISPNQFKLEIGRRAPYFSGYQQHDAQEFLRYLIDGLHEGLNRVKTKVPYSEIKFPSTASPREKSRIAHEWYQKRQDSVMSDLFMGQLRSTLQCNHCNFASLTFDPFWDLSLPLPSSTHGVTLDDCLAKLAEREVLEGDEMPTCERCNRRRESTKTIRVQRLPEVLVLHLKRFRQTGYRRSKSNVNVRFPLGALDMASVCDEAAREGGTQYALYAVSCHGGGMGGGHYTAMARGPVDEQWRYYNDSHVSDLPPERVGGSAAYILFYRRVGGHRSSSCQPSSSL